MIALVRVLVLVFSIRDSVSAIVGVSASVSVCHSVSVSASISVSVYS